MEIKLDKESATKMVETCDAILAAEPPLAPLTGSAPACPSGCGHTTQEHTAFDHGLRDGEEGQVDSANPYRAHDLREAWATGHSVGVLNRQTKSETPNTEVRGGAPLSNENTAEAPRRPLH